MKQHEKQKFLEVMNRLGAVFKEDITKDLLAAYWDSFADWTFPEFSEAATHLTRTCDFFPRPSAFEKLRKAAQTSPREAWQRAMDHATGVGSDWRKSRTCGDERIDKAVGVIGGYETLALEPMSEHQWLSKKFMDAYADIAEVETARNVARLSDDTVAKRRIGHDDDE